VSLATVRAAIVACDDCPRLRRYCARIARDPAARLLLVGLAPAAHGANRTGRVFTGDGSGDFLLSALHAAGFANIPTSRSADDGLILRDAYILAAVRCAPPDNKPTPDEIARCRRHLAAEIAHDAYLAHVAATHGVRPRPRPAFAHGSEARLGAGQPVLLGCYHPSRQNTNTGKLTPPMMRAVFTRARALLE
jgi:uracil-DNA glycosylase